jgi:hypothetical protein
VEEDEERRTLVLGREEIEPLAFAGPVGDVDLARDVAARALARLGVACEIRVDGRYGRARVILANQLFVGQWTRFSKPRHSRSRSTNF